MLNLEQYLKDSHGKDYELYTEENKKMEKITLGKTLCGVVLQAPTPKEKTDLAYKLQRYNLFKKLRDQKEIELSPEEKELLIELTNLQYDVFYTGQIVELIS